MTVSFTGRLQQHCNLLQKDLDTIVEWSKTWGMAFNILSIYNKTKNRIVHGYQMESQPIKTIDRTPYLGVIISKKLQWSEHKDKISSAANRMLGFLTGHQPSVTAMVSELGWEILQCPKQHACRKW